MEKRLPLGLVFTSLSRPTWLCVSPQRPPQSHGWSAATEWARRRHFPGTV